MRKYLSVIMLILFLASCDGNLPASSEANASAGEVSRIPSVFFEKGYTFADETLADVVPVEHAKSEEVANFMDTLDENDIDEIYFDLAETDDIVTYAVIPRYAGLRFELYEEENAAPVYSYRTESSECIFVTVDRDDLKDHILTVIDGDEKTVLALTADAIATSEETGK